MLCLMARPQIHPPNVKTCLDVVNTYNNAAERGLREPVVHRKVRGSIRSEETMKWWGNLFTCIMTWRARNVDIHEELAKYV